VSIAIETQDIRQKVREKKIGNTIVFVVDSSGSMGANRRMTAVKGAVLSLLMDAYQKRDRVGLVAFKGEKAEVLLAPTSSVELAEKHLAVLPTGGKTPLAHGLLTGYELIRKELRKSIKIKPLLVLISDGKANVGMGKGAIGDEIRDITEEIKQSGIPSIVIDTETGLIAFGKAVSIAEYLGGKYYKLDTIYATTIVEAVHDAIGAE